MRSLSPMSIWVLFSTECMPSWTGSIQRPRLASARPAQTASRARLMAWAKGGTKAKTRSVETDLEPLTAADVDQHCAHRAGWWQTRNG